MIIKGIVQGPTLAVAASAASQLGAIFPPDVALLLLRHSNPSVRASACVCVRAGRDIVAALIELLNDLDREVSTAAACALGRMGRVEARDPLKLCLTERPSPRVIEAAAGVADDEVSSSSRASVAPAPNSQIRFSPRSTRSITRGRKPPRPH